MQQGKITSSFMVPLPVISLFILQVSTWCSYFLLCLHLALHSPPTHFLPSVNFPSPVSNLLLNSSPSCVNSMPHERSKPKRRSVYYILVGRHRHTGSPSLPPNHGSSSVNHPYSNQNWHDNDQSTPQLPDPKLNYGDCIVEEEIQPNLGEDIKEMTAPTCTALPLNYLGIVMGSCVVEEEIPP